MLCLTRQSGQGIVFTDSHGATIRLYTLLRKDGRIRVGIEAPDSVRVLREELWLAQEAEREARAEIVDVPDNRRSA